MSASSAKLSTEAEYPQLCSLLVASITPGPWNPRKHRDPVRQAELVASIRQHGVLQPIVVKANGTPDKYLIIAGTSRHAAAIEADLVEIPAVIRNGLTDAQCQEIACLENLNRADLHPLDEAEAFARLRKVDKAYTVEALAARFGKPESYITRRLSLLALPAVIRSASLEDVITPAHAEKLAKLPKAQQLKGFRACFFDLRDQGLEAVKAAEAGKWSELREWVASPASLQAWIDDHIRLDITDPDQQARLEGLADVAHEAATAKRPDNRPAVVEVSREWHLTPAERKALPGVLTLNEFIEIKPGAYPVENRKTCPSTERALVVHGGRPAFLQICRDKDCAVHHPKPKPVERPAAGKAEKRKPTAYELAEQKRRAQQAVFAKFKGAAFRAIAPTLLKASLNAAFVRELVGGHQLPEISKKFGIVLSDKTATAVLMANTFLEDGWSRANVAKLSKMVGFDLGKFERAQAKAAKVAKAATVKKPVKAVAKKKGRG